MACKPCFSPLLAFVLLFCWRYAMAAAVDVQALVPRATCSTVTVQTGDSCSSLATKCKISGSDFMKYNSQSGLCANLQRNQLVCCSAGTLPDIRPKPNPNGTCATYTVQPNDYCASIASAHGLQTADLETFNAKTTWGWSGCDHLDQYLNICLSTGSPPLPAPVQNAVCGPIKPGTTVPSSGVDIASLNPCPLNACCDRYGQCGTTPEFCQQEAGPTGNPGTAPVGHNGCISNCGTAITNNAQAPSSFRNIGYYESWNMDRNCMILRATDIDDSLYTHIHWSFGVVSSAFDVSVNDTYQQWSSFQSLNSKKVISFGGWGFSTDPSTYNVLRQAMLPANAGTFATNIVNFLTKNNLDGVDIDWEYPGAPDIPGIPAGQASDGPNYLAFLQTLKSKLPAGKTLSIAAPASYWYLKAFPIADMAKVVDYIVFMTYDLHGQWDYGNQFSMEGCSTSGCLRSHVNLTETNYALAMITKAGVPAAKLNIGISSYGRSFQKTQPGCTGPLCGFTGPSSGAQPGQCTNTAGYIANAEIYDILGSNPSTATTWFDNSSSSDLMVYNNDQWVAFMSPATRAARSTYYKGLNFGGTVDWAVDLGVDDNPALLNPKFPQRLSSLPPAPDPYPNGIPTIPAVCQNQTTQTQACLDALGNSDQRGHVALDFRCNDKQKNIISTAFRDALRIALHSQDFPKTTTKDGRVANYYFGPDWVEEPYERRIHDNLQRIANFSGIGIHPDHHSQINCYCDDLKSICKNGGNKVNGSPIAYAYTNRGNFWDDHIIVFCKSFFLTSTLDEKYDEMAEEVKNGNTEKLNDMRYYATTGSLFFHEMMHLDIATNHKDGGTSPENQPDIIDEYVAYIPPGEKGGPYEKKAYGPANVWKLAHILPRNHGGCERSTTNADSYTMHANAVWWWDILGYFPGVPKRPTPRASDTGSSLAPPQWPILIDAGPYEGNVSSATIVADLVDDLSHTDTASEIPDDYNPYSDPNTCTDCTFI